MKSNKVKPIIVTNYKYKTIKITRNPELRESEEITGPYLSMYNYRYKGFTWINYKTWSGESKPSLLRIQEITRYTKWEKYVYSVIVEQGTTFDEMVEITGKLGYVPDYFLMKFTGKVELLHQTKYIDHLIQNGYTLTDYKDGEGNFSFGRGVYCLDKTLFTDLQKGWPVSEDVYTGNYDGEYLRCVEDTCNGLKCGELNKYQQEIVIPFIEKEIIWKKKL